MEKTKTGETHLINHNKLKIALQEESRKFKEYYLWLEKDMPSIFFEEIPPENIMLIVHNLMDFHLQDYFSTINLKEAAIVISVDSPDADLRILQNYAMYGIKNYQAYISKESFPGSTNKLRIAILYFTGSEDTKETLSPEIKEHVLNLVKQQSPKMSDTEFEKLLQALSGRFVKSLSLDKLAISLEMFFRAQTRDSCQYEVRYEQDWEETKTASMQIVLAWKNTPKHNFLYRLARTIHRHQLVIKKVEATYVDPYGKDSILIMSLELHGINEQATWDVADIPDFLREFATVKYFSNFDLFEEKLVIKGVINGNMGNLLRAMLSFIHQALVHIDPNLYTIENIEADLCRHPELTFELCEAFKYKFHPELHDFEKYSTIRTTFLSKIEKLDTGREEYDNRRKIIFAQAMSMIHHTLKTNAYRLNFTALSFRLDPKYLDHIPFDRAKKFPELPYAIFFIKGMHFFGFHIRFKDLSRGGLRTVFPALMEHMVAERNNMFTECYNLSLTQHMKNKDIPEAGAKGIIFLKPFSRLDSETDIYRSELERSKISEEIIEERLAVFRKEQNTEYLYHAQRSFIEGLLILVNCEPNGKLRAKRIVDYWKKPEYLYLGPDENMHDSMIIWITELSKKCGYRPGTAFISSKPKIGINHKEYGVTSLGVNVYMHEVLNYLGIDPLKDLFTLKMSGGPDGDVAGNQIVNLYKKYPKTAKLIALTDISGTIKDSQGLDLATLVELFKQGKSIRFYPPEKLSNGGFLLDKYSIRQTTALAQQTLCWKRKGSELIQEWLSGSDMNHLLRDNVHRTKTDIFIPSGGRPRTLNELNYRDFLDETGKPTSKAIIEGANLYLTQAARRKYEELGTLIIKDSSANKTGVVCSSFEVLCGLTLGDELFFSQKDTFVNEILSRLQLCALHEAQLLLREHKETGFFLTDIANKTSERINQFTYQLLDHLEPLPLSKNQDDPLIRAFLNYCLPTLKEKYIPELLSIPDHHKKAIIACYLGSQLVYKKGLHWFPSIVDVLPLVLKESI
ncbi:putative NAD-specific glutamate dehydrogenase [Chlamydiales bacterium STE3]|nr:putative NAD-specific glutamate dehydrogenase [Chlamydiales bacterium STE3]